MAAIAFRYITPVRPLPLTSAGDTTHKNTYNDTEIVRVMYRVKTWKLNATSTFTVTSIGQVTTCNWINVILTGAYTTETDLQRGPQIFQSITTPPTSKTGLGSANINTTIFDVVSGALTNAIGFNSATGLWYPQFIFTLTARNSTGSLSGVLATTAVGGTGGLVTFDGLSWGANISTDANTTLTASASMAPDTYWPYDPGDGMGPIYNTTTGAAIRNPFAP